MAMKGISDAIARQEWLNPVEEAGQGLVRRQFESRGERGRKVQNLLHGTWLGHPLHVVLTDIPIGAWTAAMVFDAMESISNRREFGTAADACVAIGLVGAIGAAVTGATDWQAIDKPARRIGLVHGMINLLGASLFAASLVKRRSNSRGAGKGLSTLGYLAAAFSAQLGGDLVYDQRIGVDHSPAQGLPEEFAPVMNEADLRPDEPTRAKYKGFPILIVRRGQRTFAIAETCSHLGGPLAQGKLEGDVIECPWHGSQFSLVDGSVVNGPAVHPQPCMETRVRDGKIEVRSARAYRGIQSSDVTASPEMTERMQERRTGS